MLAHLAASVLLLGAFLLCLVLPIPFSISRSLTIYSLPLLLGVLLLYFVSFGLPARYAWLAATGLTLLLLALSLSFLWHSGYSDDKIIGGLLPFRDGLDYFNGADWILRGAPVRTINEGAAWRPLYPGFLSAMLWITGRNLQWALAIQVGLAGLCFSVAIVRIWSRLGAAAAALFATLLYFFIQPLIGTAYTETLGLALGCLGFVLLSDAAEKRGTRNLILGLVLLMLAVSTRAGAFFIFPVMVLWAGWAWRKAGKFSLRHAALALIVVLVSYAVVNILYNRLMVEPGGFPFGNFAFTLYGQVNGGAGYHKAFEDLAARNPEVILRAAWQFFLAHPQGLIVGSLKAYRDFFSPLWGAFSLGSGLHDMALSVAATALLLVGIYRAVRRIVDAEASLLVAGFIGILLSVPFLPPIDGGIRIYASTMPFIYALPALALGGLLRSGPVAAKAPVAAPASLMSLVLGLLMILVPMILRFANPAPSVNAPSCAAEQVSFAATLSEGTYIDLVPEGPAVCGRLPHVCLGRFQAYGTHNDPSDAAVFDQLAVAAEPSTIRVFVGNDLLQGRPHIFVVPLPALDEQGDKLITGCATESQVKGRPSIYSVQ